MVELRTGSVFSLSVAISAGSRKGVVKIIFWPLRHRFLPFDPVDGEYLENGKSQRCMSIRA